MKSNNQNRWFLMASGTYFGNKRPAIVDYRECGRENDGRGTRESAMNYRRWTTAVEWSLLAVVVAAFALGLLFRDRVAESVPLGHLLTDAVPLVGAMLLTAWLIGGPGWPWLRGGLAGILVLVLAAIAIREPLVLLADPDRLWLVVAVASCVAAIAFRLGGLKLYPLPGGHPEPRPQFSIRTLLLATTAVAVTVGLLELVRPQLLARTEWSEGLSLVISGTGIEWSSDSPWLAFSEWRQLVLGLSLAGVIGGAIFAVVRPGPVWLRLTVLVVVVPTLAVYLTHLIGIQDVDFQQRSIELVAALAACASLAAVAVLPLRLMGFRLLRRIPT